MSLRPYQQDAFDAAVQHMKKSFMPGLLELATGAGKSHIIAAIAEWVYQRSGKRVLCLAPSSELVNQNYSKYIATGNKASIYSASAGMKSLRHPVVYGTPGTVKNAIKKFQDGFAAVIVDEAHKITPSIQYIIHAIKQKNKKLRVIGLTATPYRMNTGYIYRYDIDGVMVPENQTIDPYFQNLLYSIRTRDLIAMGYLTPAHADPDHVAGYDAGGLQVNNRGQFNAKDVEQVFEGKGRLTADIVADIVQHAIGRKGVLIFAATVKHAEEIMESLPPNNSMMIGGEINMKKQDRQKLVNDFKERRFKYLVNVATMTTGVDFTHVDVVAILRATESASLLQQIIGRGLRLDDGKTDCLVLDYAENISRHGLEDDLFDPKIRVKKQHSEDPSLIQAECEQCGFVNDFVINHEYKDFERDQYGYVIDGLGHRIESKWGYVPAHHGRRCTAQVQVGVGIYDRCSYRWTLKKCEECGHENDLAARQCEECKAELVDPNEKLKRDFMRVKQDPYTPSTDEVLEWTPSLHYTRSGKMSVRCTYKTEYRTFTIYYNPWSKHSVATWQWRSLCNAVYGHIAPDAETFIDHLSKGNRPATITYRKQKNSEFYEAIDHNRPVDVLEVA